ncbi:Clc-like protein 5 [Aphelenchoides besseyi]|nr:Clc-like protein 5 [Aphelenchoides besseyi]
MSQMGNFTRIVVIVTSMFLLIGGLVLNIIGGLSPSWQVVDIREFQAEHHHGLWLDCTRAERAFITNKHISDHSPLQCTYKFDAKASDLLDENARDIDGNSAAAESEHHQFFGESSLRSFTRWVAGWHKAILIFIVLALCSGTLAVFVGFCSPCSSAYSLIYSFLTFVTCKSSISLLFTFFSVFSSTVAVGVFFFAAHRVDSRFVTGLVATYEQEIGSAFYFYSVGTILHFLVFILSVVVTFQALREGREDDDDRPIRDLAPLYRQQYGKTTV